MSEPLPQGHIRFVPLGGLGEIGMNCFALEHREGIIIVDCGIAFPGDDLGVDVIHPDFSWLEQRADRISGLFLTHGHEDHIGAVPYLLRKLQIPVWGPPHALGVVRRRLEEHAFRDGEAELSTANTANVYRVGPFLVEPVRMAHSIVEASGLSIRVDGLSIFHTGDFNLDPAPPDGEPTDVGRLKALGREGVHLLTSDSTNIDVATREGSEAEVGRALEDLVRDARGRVFVAMFSSNIQRLMLLADIAKKTDRKICLLGRSLRNQTEVAREIGRLDLSDTLLLSSRDLAATKRNQVLILAGGSQGEARSAMRRIAAGSHPDVRIEPGDTVVHSARVIPGNDRPAFAMFCDLLRQGAILHNRYSDPNVHTSGHAGRSEQTQMIEWLKPKHFIPLHGTLHHLKKHASLAESLGVKSTLVVENGTPVRLSANGTFHTEKPVPHGHVHVAYGGKVLDPPTLSSRAQLGRAGSATISIAVDLRGRSVAAPIVQTLGVPNVDGNRAALRDATIAVGKAIGAATKGNVEEAARRAARKVLRELSGTKPLIVVNVLEVD